MGKLKTTESTKNGKIQNQPKNPLTMENIDQPKNPLKEGKSTALPV